MPTYEYKCLACGKVFEYFQSMKDEPLKECLCDHQKGKVERLISLGSGIIFKGSGFYVTDYKKNESKSTSGSSETSKGSGGGESSTKETASVS